MRVIERGAVRDTTTAVAPNADLKVFLTASIEERARRRWLEMTSKGRVESLNAVVIDVVAASGADIPSPAPGTNAPMDGAQVTAIARAVAANF